MRLWTLHPRYLDAQGLVALWREGLLAKHVLSGRTKGYRHHPQLLRFRECRRPEAAIDVYLQAVLEESRRRNYRFDPAKLDGMRLRTQLPETRGQLDYEWSHLMRKLRARDGERHAALQRIKRPEAHPLFRLMSGDVQPWEHIL